MNTTRLLCLLAIFISGALKAQTVPVELQSKFPALKLQVKIGTKREQDRAISYRKYMDITPSVVTESSLTQPVAAAKATMLVITMDTEEKYRHRRDKYVVFSNQTLDVPAADKGTRRDFSFKTVRVNFDAWRDASNVGGMTYKYYVFGLRDAATGKLLYFETNCAPLTALIKRQPERVEEFLKMTADSEFPSSIK